MPATATREQPCRQIAVDLADAAINAYLAEPEGVRARGTSKVGIVGYLGNRLAYMAAARTEYLA